MNISKEKILFSILAGGQSKRFGGGYKTFTKISGKTMLNHIIKKLSNYSNDIIYVNGAWTDNYNRLAGDKFHLPNIGLGEYPYGWWILDIDGDNIADGTDPKNWDTDGDWLNDYFEIKDDLLDGI